ncbi:MAG: glycosyltransferase family 4 protein [Proteobacteria bacterium]|nr:glycosyltransferase family 4 protein [Pseudomonadota bacterium]
MRQKKPKILFVSHTSDLGGAENVLLSFLNEVSEFEPVVFLPQGDLSLGLKQNNIETIESRFLGKLHKESNHFWVFKFLLRFIGTLFELVCAIRETKPDGVQSNNFYTVVYCILPSVLSRTPLIWHMHDFVEENWKHQVLSKIFDRFVCKIVAVSEAVRQDLLKTGISENKLTVVYNSISRKQLDYAGSTVKREISDFRSKFDLIVGMLGTIEERKGVLECVQAAEILVRTGRLDMGLVIAGKAKDPSHRRYMDSLIDVIRQNRLENKVLFLGHIREIESFFQEIDVFVHYPKQPDPLPTVILEAIAAGCPVIVSNNGGNPECIQFGKWGVAVAANQPERLAEKIFDREAHSLSQKESQEFLEFFSHEKKECLHLAIYQKLTSKRKRSRRKNGR